MLILDVDNFKCVNDTLGHGIGDDVLRDLTATINSILLRDDLLGRFGGDEFFVFLNDISGRETEEKKAKQICELEIHAQGSDMPITVSMGIAMIPHDGNDFDALYKKVDSTLYREKESRKNGFVFCD